MSKHIRLPHQHRPPAGLRDKQQEPQGMFTPYSLCSTCRHESRNCAAATSTARNCSGYGTYTSCCLCDRTWAATSPPCIISFRPCLCLLSFVMAVPPRNFIDLAAVPCLYCRGTRLIKETQHQPQPSGPASVTTVPGPKKQTSCTFTKLTLRKFWQGRKSQ